MKSPASTHPLRRAANAFSILSQRVRELGHSGLTLWSDAGTRAVSEISITVGTAAQTNRAAQLNMAGDIESMLADGVIDASEAARLRAHHKTLVHCAQRSSTVVETVAI